LGLDDVAGRALVPKTGLAWRKGGIGPVVCDGNRCDGRWNSGNQTDEAGTAGAALNCAIRMLLALLRITIRTVRCLGHGVFCRVRYMRRLRRGPVRVRHGGHSTVDRCEDQCCDQQQCDSSASRQIHKQILTGGRGRLPERPVDTAFFSDPGNTPGVPSTSVFG
jgi:hypothetical protein